jgi:DNA-binding CsgD family transcriptional regulator
VRTVDHHRENICHKLQLSGTYALLRFALTHRDFL